MVTEQILVTIISSVVSGILGLIISTIFYIRYKHHEQKINTLRSFMSNRFDLVGDEFSRTINEIFVVFAKSPKVMKALSYFHGEVVKGQGQNDTLLMLFKEMCKDVRLPFDKFNDSFFLRPFNTRTTNTTEHQSNRLS